MLMNCDASAFSLPYVWSAFAGANAVASGLEALGVRRPALIVNRSVAKSPAFSELIRTVRRVCVRSDGPPVFCDIRPHTPLSTVLEVAAMVRAFHCDSVISVGAGSAIDAAKGAVLAIGAEVASAEEWGERLGIHGFSDLAEGWTGPVRPHLAIPTTLSSAAHSHAAGITISGEKHLNIDPRLGPRVVAFDGALARDTPVTLWVATGIKALDHAVESLYSRGLPPLIKPWRIEAFAVLINHLSESANGPQDKRGHAREILLAAAAMSVAGWPSPPLGLSHALGHQAGAQWGMSHGTTSPIFLPAVMAFNVPVASAAFELMANALDRSKRPGRSPSETVIEAVEELIRTVGLPRRLSEVGVVASDLNMFAVKVLRDPIMVGNPRVVTERDIIKIVADVG
jgi:maleylacetate reductase